MPHFTESSGEVLFDLTDFITTIELCDYSGDGKVDPFERESISLTLRIAPFVRINKGTSPDYEKMMVLLEVLKEFSRRKQKKGIKPNYKMTVISHNSVLVAQGYFDRVKARIQYREVATDFILEMHTDSYTISHGTNAVRKHLLDTAIADMAA